MSLVTLKISVQIELLKKILFQKKNLIFVILKDLHGQNYPTVNPLNRGLSMYQRCKMTFILNIQLSFGFQLSFSRRDLFIVTIVEVHVHHICNFFCFLRGGTFAKSLCANNLKFDINIWQKISQLLLILFLDLTDDEMSSIKTCVFEVVKPVKNRSPLDFE